MRRKYVSPLSCGRYRVITRWARHDAAITSNRGHKSSKYIVLPGPPLIDPIQQRQYARINCYLLELSFAEKIDGGFFSLIRDDETNERVVFMLYFH